MEPTITNLPDRPRPQQERIIQTLRNAIITGELAPGDRIPPRRELAEQLSASLLTVQQALDRLAREGFVKPRGRLGTFVVDRPPHLTQYALVFEHRPNNRQFPRFWSALAQETHGLSSPDITVKPWYGVEAHADNEDFQRLCGLVRSHRIGGIIFPASPHPYLNSPLLDEPGISRVAPLTPDTVSLFPTVRPVYLAPMLERALEYFASRGRKRVAVLHHASVAVPPPETFAKFGLTLEPFLWQGASLSHPETARRLAHLMVRRQQDHPPDALFIGDDNFVEYATAGIIDAGARVGEDLEVVGHCNFPWPTPSAIPLRRLGYDVREFLDVSLKTLQQQRDGQEHPPYTVPARFEDELTFPQ